MGGVPRRVAQRSIVSLHVAASLCPLVHLVEFRIDATEQRFDDVVAEAEGEVLEVRVTEPHPIQPKHEQALARHRALACVPSFGASPAERELTFPFFF